MLLKFRILKVQEGRWGNDFIDLLFILTNVCEGRDATLTGVLPF